MAQLLQQVESYIDQMGEEKEYIQKYLIILKWEDIIKMLLDVQRETGEVKCSTLM